MITKRPRADIPGIGRCPNTPPYADHCPSPPRRTPRWPLAEEVDNNDRLCALDDNPAPESLATLILDFPSRLVISKRLPSFRVDTAVGSRPVAFGSSNEC